MIAASFLMVLVFFSVITLGLIRPAFQQLEKQQITDNISRIKSGIEQQIEKVKQINEDWSNWDDTAIFAKSGNKSFIDTNLADFGFQEKTIGINLCFIFNEKHQALFSQLWDTDLGGEIPIQPAMKTFPFWQALFPEDWKFDQTKSGLIKIDSFVFLVSASPIYDSKGEGPSNGLLIFGRLLDDHVVKDIVDTVHIPFSAKTINPTFFTTEEADFLKNPGIENSIQIDVQQKRVKWNLLSDVKNNPVLFISMPIPGTIAKFQQNLFVYLLFAFAIVLLFFIFTYSFFTKKKEEITFLHQSGIKRNAQYIVFLVILAGITLSVCLFWFLRNQNEERIHTAFKLDCADRLLLLQERESHIMPELQWLRRIFLTKSIGSAKEFSQFARPILQTNPFQSIEWITNQNGGSFPITFQETLDDAVSLGKNLFLDSEFRSVMEKSRDSSLPSSSLPKRIGKDNTGVYVTTIFLPVYKTEPIFLLEEKRKQLKGFIAGTIQLESYFKSTLHQSQPKGLPLLIYDVTDPRKPVLVYTHIPRLGTAKPDSRYSLQFKSVFTFANRQYQIEIRPNQEYCDALATSYHWLFLLFSLIVTLLFSIYLFRTLTQKEQAERLVEIRTKELNDSKERYKCTLQSIGDGVIAVDLDGNVTGLNPVAVELTGWLESEAIGKPFQAIFDIISASCGEKAVNPLIKVLETGKIVHLSNDTTLIHKQGHRYQIADSAAPIIDNQGLVSGAVMIFRDISKEYETKKALQESEEMLKAQNILLQELMSKKDDLLSIAAHDIRSPLTVIKGYADLLLLYSKTSLTSDQVEMISKIQGSTKFIIQLLNDLLDFSALESGKVNLDKQSADFESYIKNYILNTIIVAHQKNMEIYSEIQKDIPLISFDPMKIQQVLNNLTSNAIKFSNPGSDIHVTVKTDKKFVYVSVTDKGQGIPENEIPQLFTPFLKTSVKSTGGEKSTGLGLVIARNIVRAHGGDMFVISEVGIGSTFTFTLPLSL